MSEVLEKAQAARAAARVMRRAGRAAKDKALLAIASALRDGRAAVLQANTRDLERAQKRGISGAMLKRLTLDERKIEGMAAGVEAVAALPDPVGEYTGMWRRPNGLQIGQVRVPLGVVGIIYESRPNVTLEAASLCLKTGNATVLRGGSEALESNRAIVEVIHAGLRQAGVPADAVQLITDPDRRLAQEMMRANGLIDVLIPRGGAGLIQAVVQNATVPVIETGVGVCHVYVHEDADLDMAERIVVNAKVSNPAVCNAMETLLVDRAVAQQFLPRAAAALRACGVELRGCPAARSIAPVMAEATEADWAEEYLDLILAARVVDGLDQALEHIERYGTKHSEAIVTEDYSAATRFLEEVDAAAVYVNASTRFTDGFEFGFGAEVGISTQKLHARGPMGLKELTSTKYVILGHGQVRQ